MRTTASLLTAAALVAPGCVDDTKYAGDRLECGYQLGSPNGPASPETERFAAEVDQACRQLNEELCIATNCLGEDGLPVPFENVDNICEKTDPVQIARDICAEAGGVEIQSALVGTPHGIGGCKAACIYPGFE